MRQVRAAQDRGKKVLLVTSDRPYSVLRSAADQEGVDGSGLMLLDSITTTNGDVPSPRPLDVVFVPSPTMLEMVAMRVEQIHQRMGGDVHVIVDSLSSFSLYNRPKAVEEFSHYLVNRLRAIGASGALVVNDDPEGEAMRDAIAPFTDGTHPLEETLP